MRTRLLYLQFVILALIGVLDIYFGLDRMYFWKLWWFDIPLHVLGGVWAALFVAWVAAYAGYRMTLAAYVASALVIGVGWEVFEYAGHMAGSMFMSHPVDTVKDLINDCIGGALAYALARFFRV